MLCRSVVNHIEFEGQRNVLCILNTCIRHSYKYIYIVEAIVFILCRDISTLAPTSQGLTPIHPQFRPHLTNTHFGPLLPWT